MFPNSEISQAMVIVLYPAKLIVWDAQACTAEQFRPT
jgi:hypothetical protein